MAIVHQESGFTFFIEASYPEPPHVRITKGKGVIIIRIGVPEMEAPHIEEYKGVTRKDVDVAYNIVWTYQEKFMGVWERNHNFTGKVAVLDPIGKTKNIVKRGWKRDMEGLRLRLKPKAKKEQIKEAVGGIHDRRFMPLQKKLIEDLDNANFKSIDLGLYMRLGGWSHTGGTYSNTMIAVEALCEVLFGYALPEKIGKIFFKVHRYHSPASLAKIAPTVNSYHEGRIGK